MSDRKRYGRTGELTGTGSWWGVVGSWWVGASVDGEVVGCGGRGAQVWMGWLQAQRVTDNCAKSI